MGEGTDDFLGEVIIEGAAAILKEVRVGQAPKLFTDTLAARNSIDQPDATAITGTLTCSCQLQAEKNFNVEIKHLNLLLPFRGLVMQIESAENLSKADFIGNSDPFVKFVSNTDKLLGQTSAVHDTQNPVTHACI